MARATILLADNDKDYRETCRDFLIKANFNVKTAGSPAEAKAILERGVDLAILDLRLASNSDKKDISGFTLAQTVATETPKIVLSEWDAFEAATTALGAKLDGLSLATGFVSKADGLQSLLATVRNALQVKSRYRQVSGSLAHKLDNDYRDARQQAFWSYWISLVIALIGAALVFVGAYLALKGTTTVAVISTLAGVITEVSGVLFFRRADNANARMDRYHQELLEIRRLENLLEACGELFDYEAQERCKAQAINAAIGFWMKQNPASTHQLPSLQLLPSANEAANKD